MHADAMFSHHLWLHLHKGDGEFSSVAFTCSDEKGTISTVEVLQDHLGFSARQATVKPSTDITAKITTVTSVVR